MRTFHLTGRGLDEFVPAGPLRPTLLDRLELPCIEHSYPLYCAGSEAPQPLFRKLESAGFPILRDYLELIVGAFADQLAANESTPVAAVFDAAISAAGVRLEMLHVPGQAVEREFAALRKLLSGEGSLIPFGKTTLALLHAEMLTLARRDARAAFARELEETSHRLEGLLATDARPVGAALGRLAASFFKPATLAQALDRRTNSALPMEPERRARCQSALEVLQSAENQPAAILADSCDQALQLSHEQVRRYTRLWQALRIARLEFESAFDPAVHAEALEAFDWTMAQPGEIAAMPVIVANEIAPNLEAFGRVLQSGLPIQVLITSSDGLERQPGCLPIAYQDVFALHSSLAEVEHLLGGLTEMARTLRPAVAAVAACETWIASALLAAARAWPLYRYDPDRGESWRERFALQMERSARSEELNFAYVAALQPAFRMQFRVLPASAGPVEPAFPFFFVTDEEGEQSQAVFTREISTACSAAQRRWRFLAELDPAVAERTRREGATEAIHRVIAMLGQGGL
jgi:hypothetical protein